MSAPKLDEEAIFGIARRMPAELREAYLLQVCAGDDSLRERVVTLLAAHDQSGGLFRTPAQNAAVENESKSRQVRIIQSLAAIIL